jgi:hypothetical protein
MDPDPHQSLYSGLVEAQIAAIKGRGRSQWRLKYLVLEGTYIHCRALVADSHQFSEKQDPHPDPHQSEKLDLKQHKSENRDPDPHQGDANPPHWVQATIQKAGGHSFSCSWAAELHLTGAMVTRRFLVGALALGTEGMSNPLAASASVAIPANFLPVFILTFLADFLEQRLDNTSAWLSFCSNRPPDGSGVAMVFCCSVGGLAV